MIDRKAGDRVAGLTKRLFVLFLAMVIAGFALPSPGVSAPELRVGAGISPYRELARPTRPDLLIIDSIAVRAPVIPINLDPYGNLVPPGDVSEVGWWRQSAKPGSASGQTLITGHTVHTGGGVLDRLGEVRPGDIVKIRTHRGTVWYRATDVLVYSKARLARNAVELFGQDRSPNRLVLVTCSQWDGSAYLSNTVVFADPLGVPNYRHPAKKKQRKNAAAAG